MSSEENEPTQAAANAEIRLEHEGELFTVEDARITALETQATAVIAAAIATAAFFFAATDAAASWKEVAVIGLGAVALGTALLARADAPWGLRQEGRSRIQEVNDADEAARAMNELKEDPFL